MTTYVATVNMPGYLPMDDDPPTFESALDGWVYLADVRRRDEEDMSCDETCEDGPACQWSQNSEYTETVRELEHALELVMPDGTGVIHGDTPGSHSDHDLGLVYSVSIVIEEDDYNYL